MLSSFLLITYLAFLLIEQLLFSSNSFEEVVPWDSFERNLATIRVLLRFIISLAYIFDKEANFRWQINLVCAVIMAYIVVKRNQNSIIFDTSVFYATIIQETLQMWLFFIVAIHKMAETDITMITNAGIFLTGLFLGCAFVAI